jgi:hypothetical protein
MQPESCKAEQSNAKHTKSICAAWPRTRGGSLGFGRTLFEPQPSATNAGCMRSKDEPSFAAHPLEEHGLAPQQCTLCLAKHRSHSGHSSCWQQHRPSRSSHTSIRQKCYKVHIPSNPIRFACPLTVLYGGALLLVLTVERTAALRHNRR